MSKSTTTKIGGILTTLFRTIQHDLNADNPARQEKLMELFLADSRNKIPKSNNHRASARGNLNKDLNNDSITMKTFIKLMAFLRIYKFKIIIEIPHINGINTQHEVSIEINNDIGYEELSEKSENGNI